MYREPITYEVVYAVVVHGRDDGLYLFRNHDNASRFRAAVQAAGGSATLTEEPINHALTTDALIAQELAD